MQGVRAILLDLDGVLYVGDAPIAGAKEAVRALADAGFLLAGITNTTTKPVRAIREKLARMGFPAFPIYTPAALARRHIGARRAWLVVREALKEDFAGVREDAAQPEVIVMGDVGGAGYAPELVQTIFRHVMDGAELVALHKNRFWQTEEGLVADLGAWVAAVEYATGKQALVLGKPSRDFFHAACRALGAAPSETLVVGDDVESDVGGAQAAGLHGCLVHTGKYRAEFVAASGVHPEMEVPSIAALPKALSR